MYQGMNTMRFINLSHCLTHERIHTRSLCTMQESTIISLSFILSLSLSLILTLSRSFSLSLKFSKKFVSVFFYLFIYLLILFYFILYFFFLLVEKMKLERQYTYKIHGIDVVHIRRNFDKYGCF